MFGPAGGGLEAPRPARVSPKASPHRAAVRRNLSGKMPKPPKVACSRGRLSFVGHREAEPHLLGPVHTGGVVGLLCTWSGVAEC